MFATLTAITPSDKSLFYKTLLRWRPFTKSYEDSWGYIIQATRYDGRKWYDPTTKSLIFFGRKSPSSDTLVIPNFFAEPTCLKEIIEKLPFQYNASQIILKNINPNDIHTFTPYGFRPYHNHERWSVLARFDDQTYPQLLVNLEALLNPKGKKYHQLKRLLNKNPQVTLRIYDQAYKEDVLKIFVAKDKSMNNAFKIKDMYYKSHAMYPSADIDKFVIIEKGTNKIIGFTAVSDISSSTTALVASIFEPGVQIASIWGIYHTLLLKYRQGFQIVNLGGLETEGSYTFLRRTFRPTEELAKTHLMYTK